MTHLDSVLGSQPAQELDTWQRWLFAEGRRRQVTWRVERGGEAVSQLGILSDAISFYNVGGTVDNNSYEWLLKSKNESEWRFKIALGF